MVPTAPIPCHRLRSCVPGGGTAGTAEGAGTNSSDFSGGSAEISAAALRCRPSSSAATWLESLLCTCCVRRLCSKKSPDRPVKASCSLAMSSCTAKAVALPSRPLASTWSRSRWAKSSTSSNLLCTCSCTACACFLAETISLPVDCSCP
eukprot:Skav207747  [mRNA]  locus=scaffold362:510973:517848:+ [translate_table: standard]